MGLQMLEMVPWGLRKCSFLIGQLPSLWCLEKGKTVADTSQESITHPPFTRPLSQHLRHGQDLARQLSSGLV